MFNCFKNLIENFSTLKCLQYHPSLAARLISSYRTYTHDLLNWFEVADVRHDEMMCYLTIVCVRNVHAQALNLNKWQIMYAALVIFQFRSVRAYIYFQPFLISLLRSLAIRAHGFQYIRERLKFDFVI